MTKPLITIITATYNAQNTLEKAITSIINQTLKNYELIIIDGGSKDNTLSIIEKYKENIANYISEEDRGIYNAWNKGIKLSKGDWIMFVGADDILLPETIETYTHFILDQKDDIDFITAKVKIINKQGRTIMTKGKNWTWFRFRRFMDITHVGALHSKAYFEKYGYFNDSYQIAGDYELLLRARHNLKSKFIDRTVAEMTLGGKSTSDIKVFIETFHAKVNTGKISIISCSIDFIIAVAKFQIKKMIRYNS